MKTTTLWTLSIPLALAGAVIILLADSMTGTMVYVMYGIGALLELPFFLTVNIAAQRKRGETGADQADSMEFAAARQARSSSFIDGIIIAAVLMAVSAFFPTTFPVLWLFGFLLIYVTAFWIRYLRALKTLRG